MSQEPEIINDWIREKVLGSGAFGVVTLWRNSKTNEKIAIKKYRGEHAASLTSKHKLRWTNEVEMMQRINNENIISFRKLPEDFERELQKYNMSRLPMLSMEFCEGGDLRSVLSRAENCCGLRENDVRNALSDLANAVSYLHSLGISHRDLKPENVVLCPNEDRIVCKLIDLGYAKEIDAGSVAASLVGTIQYLAPEFFYSRTYSCSVDYWSLGLVSFELACGMRPFLPNKSPAQWMRYVQDKKHEDICIWEEQDGTIRHSQEIWPETHISPFLRDSLSEWLRLPLEFNPKQRGRNPLNTDDTTPFLFTQLHYLLQQKVLSVIYVPLMKFLHYQIDDYTLVETLCGWVERDTKLVKKEQLLFGANGKKIESEQLVIQYFDKTYTTDPMIYIFKKSEIQKIEMPSEIPKLVRNMLENMSAIPYHFQKQSYAHALYFIYRENHQYNTLLDACQIRLNHIQTEFTEVKTKCNTMTEKIDKLIAQKEFSKEILDFDVAQYLKRFSQDAKHWQNSHENISEEIERLSDIYQKLLRRYESVKRRISAVKEESENKYSKYSKHILDKMLNDALELYRKLKRKPKEKRFKPESCSNMIKVVYTVLKERSNLINDKSFALYQQKILDLELEVEKIYNPLKLALEHVEKIKNDLLNDHKQRQEKIWEFTIKPKQISKNNAQHTVLNSAISQESIKLNNESNDTKNTAIYQEPAKLKHITNSNKNIYEQPNLDQVISQEPTKTNLFPNDNNIINQEPKSQLSNNVVVQQPSKSKLNESLESTSNISLNTKNYPNSFKLPINNNTINEHNEKYHIDQPTMATCEPKPQFKIGSLDIDYGEPISLKAPVHFILGEVKEQLPSHATQTSPITEENKPKIVSLVENEKILPNFIIGAPTSVLISDNHNLRVELQEMTNESFLRCKSILNENLDFSFLNQ